MKMNLVAIILSILSFSCNRKEFTASYNAYFCNDSGKELTLEFYRYGVVQENFSVKSITSKECRNVFSVMGRGSTPTYGSEIIYMDSAMVTFDDGAKLVHYGYQKTGSNPKAYGNEHPRNIFGDGTGFKDNWVYRIVSETKHSKNDEIRYTFRQQDYLDAQK